MRTVGGREAFKCNSCSVFLCRGIQSQISTFELLIEDDKQKSVQIELLKHERVQLIAELAAKESLIHGLRTERRVWGHELAQQGKADFQRETSLFPKEHAVYWGSRKGFPVPPPRAAASARTSWPRAVL